MKSIKVLSLIVGAIALLPAASFADTVHGSTSETNINTTIIGHDNSISTSTKQISTNRQKSGHHADSISGNSALINANSTIIGDRNHVKQKALQTHGSYQKAR